MKTKALSVTDIEGKIHLLRGHKVMLDSDLAELYGIETRVLSQAVKRNLERFPGDFMFQLTGAEYESLRSQIVISNKGRGGRRYPPRVFTEHGAIMLASVLKSERAIEASIFVVRAFVRLREMLIVHKEFTHKLAELERRIAGHDEDIKALVSAIRRLMQPEPIKSRKIGFEKK